MNLEEQYIDYQPVESSSVPRENGVDWGISGVEGSVPMIIPRSKLKAWSRGVAIRAINWIDLGQIKRSASKIAMVLIHVAIVGGVLFVIFYLLYQVGLAIESAYVAIMLWIESGGLIKVAIGASGLLVFMAIVYMVKNAKNIRKFDDWYPQGNSQQSQTSTSSNNVTINQVVNINNGKIENK